jgi:hypothetical protein
LETGAGKNKVFFAPTTSSPPPALELPHRSSTFSQSTVPLLTMVTNNNDLPSSMLQGSIMRMKIADAIQTSV